VIRIVLTDSAYETLAPSKTRTAFWRPEDGSFILAEKWG
jgi:hypothetical protein